MKATVFTSRAYSAEAHASLEPLPAQAARAQWLLSLMALLALFMTVTGPAFSQHYAELSPTHYHIYLTGNTAHTHVLAFYPHSHSDETTGVISVSSDSGASAGFVALHIAPPSQSGVIEPGALWHSITEPDSAYSEPTQEPPDRPPKTS